LVWAVFKGIQTDPDLVVNHLDGNKQNCALSNLELTTYTVNNNHAVRSGLIFVALGEDKPNAVFSDAEVKV